MQRDYQAPPSLKMQPHARGRPLTARARLARPSPRARLQRGEARHGERGRAPAVRAAEFGQQVDAVRRQRRRARLDGAPEHRRRLQQLGRHAWPLAAIACGPAGATSFTERTGWRTACSSDGRRTLPRKQGSDSASAAAASGDPRRARRAPEKTNQTGGAWPDLAASNLAAPLTSVPRTPSFFSSPACAFASLRRAQPPSAQAPHAALASSLSRVVLFRGALAFSGRSTRRVRARARPLREPSHRTLRAPCTSPSQAPPNPAVMRRRDAPLAHPPLHALSAAAAPRCAK